MEIWDKIKEVANDVSSEAKNVADKAKLKNAIRCEQQKINDFYRQMGEKIYNSNSSAPMGYEEQFNGIKTSTAEIERLQNELSKCSKIG